MDYSNFNVTSLGGNCITADVDFGKKSPLSGTWASKGILSIECIFNKRLETSIINYNDIYNGGRVYTRDNLLEWKFQSDNVFLMCDYEFGHIDLSKEQNRNKVLNRFNDFHNINKFVYSLNEYDCKYITENSLRYIISVLNENNIQAKDIVILESCCANKDDKNNFWKNFINPIFSKFFTVYRIDYTSPQWKEQANQFLANYFSN